MRYSSPATALAALSLVSEAFAGPVNHAHGHGHAHAKKEVIERDIAYVYVTKTVIWEDPAATPVPTTTTTTPAYVAPTTTTTTLVTTTTTPAYVAPTTTTTSEAAATTSAEASSSIESSIEGSLGDIVESTITIASDMLSKILSLGVCQEGMNDASSNGNAWIGDDGSYTMEVINKASEDLVIVAWGSWGSWVNVKQPYITVSIAQGESKTLSFADGFSGALTAIYDDTTMVNGQISNTWVELTTESTGVVDVSREVNMSGHTVSVVGPDCTTDMETCVFVCDSGNVCTDGYSLLNCAAGSQVGAQSGIDTAGNGGASGGCGWSGASSAHLVATWS